MPTLHPSLIVHSIPYLSHLTTCISLNTVCCHTASPCNPRRRGFLSAARPSTRRVQPFVGVFPSVGPSLRCGDRLPSSMDSHEHPHGPLPAARPLPWSSPWTRRPRHFLPTGHLPSTWRWRCVCAWLLSGVLENLGLHNLRTNVFRWDGEFTEACHTPWSCEADGTPSWTLCHASWGMASEQSCVHAHTLTHQHLPCPLSRSDWGIRP